MTSYPHGWIVADEIQCNDYLLIGYLSRNCSSGLEWTDRQASAALLREHSDILRMTRSNLLVDSSINMQLSHLNESDINGLNFLMAADVNSRNVMVADTENEWLYSMKIIINSITAN